MLIPHQLQNIINQCLEVIRSDPQHHLSAEMREEIYYIFGSNRAAVISDFWQRADFPDKDRPLLLTKEQMLTQSFIESTVADYALCWLAVLSVEKVLPIFESRKAVLIQPDAESCEKSIKEILNLVKELLSKRVSFERVYAFSKALAWKWYEKGRKGLVYEAYCVYEAAHNALEFILTQSWLLGGNSDEIVEVNTMDFALSAMKAYSAKDHNHYGDWLKLDKEQFVEFSSTRRLEFWEWWLIEAIPQAWELASKSYNS